MVKKTRLGADPLKWIQDSREEKQDNIEQPSKQDKSELQENISNKPGKQSTKSKPSKSDNKESKPEMQNKQELPSKQKQLEISELLNDNTSKSELQDKLELQESISNKSSKSELQDKSSNTNQEKLTGGWQRATFIIREKHLEKIKALAYWDRLQIKEVMEEALEEYLSKKPVKPIPERRKI